MTTSKIYLLLAISLSLSFMGIGRGGCDAGIERSEDTANAGSEGATLTIEPTEITEIGAEYQAFVADTTGTLPTEEITWTVEEIPNFSGALTKEITNSEGVPLPRHSLKQFGKRMCNVRAEPLAAQEGDMFRITACSGDICDTHVVTYRGVLKSTDDITSILGVPACGFKYDSVGEVVTSAYDMTFKIYFAGPDAVEACSGEAPPPFTLTMVVCGSRFEPKCETYRFSFLNEKYAYDVAYIRMPAKGQQGCPDISEEPEAVLKNGTVLPYTTVGTSGQEMEENFLNMLFGPIRQMAGNSLPHLVKSEEGFLDDFEEDLKALSTFQMEQFAVGTPLLASQLIPMLRSIFDDEAALRLSGPPDTPLTFDKFAACMTEKIMGEECHGSYVASCHSLYTEGACESSYTRYVDQYTNESDLHNCSWDSRGYRCNSDGREVGDKNCKLP